MRSNSSLLFALIMLAAPLCAQPDTRELTFLNWADYIDPEIIETFHQRTGTAVKQIHFDSNTTRDQLLLETDGKGFDLVVVNGAALRILAKRGWLEPINQGDIPNLRHIEPRWRSEFEGAERYCAPYFWGTVGIAYRSDLIPVVVTSWMDLFRPHESLRGKLGMVEDAGDLIGAALKALGYSLNSTDKKELKAAEALLLEQKPHVKTYRYVSLDERSALVTGEVAMSMMYSGDAMMVKQYNEDIVYVLPEEGGNVWVDYLCVLSKSTNKSAAKQFIDFLNEPQVAAQLAQYVYYATPNSTAQGLLPPEYLNDPVIFPRGLAMQNSEPYRPLPPRTLKRRSAIFSRIVN